MTLGNINQIRSSLDVKLVKETEFDYRRFVGEFLRHLEPIPLAFDATIQEAHEYP